MKYLTFLLFFIAVLTGCTGNQSSSASTDYPSAIVWNDTLNGPSSTELSVNDIGKEIGKIERKATPMPTQNGDSNDKPAGSALFEVKGTNTQEAIAVKVNDKYFRASKLGSLH